MYFALDIVPVLVVLTAIGILVPVLARLLKPCNVADLTPEWFENFDISAYRPMQGLLAADDFQFLARQPGFEVNLYRKLRRDRLRIFRQYLNRLIVDFNRLHTVTRYVLSQSNEDQSGLFAKLISLRLQFWKAVLRVEFSYLLCRLGTEGISMDGLLDRVEEISKLAPIPEAKVLLFN